MEGIGHGGGYRWARSVVGRATAGPFTHDTPSHSCCPGLVINSSPFTLKSDLVWAENCVAMDTDTVTSILVLQMRKLRVPEARGSRARPWNGTELGWDQGLSDLKAQAFP